MKHFILLLAILSTQSFAIKSRKVVPSIGNPLPTDYSYSNPTSRVLSELPSIYSHLLINNTQPVQIACIESAPKLGEAPVAALVANKEIVIPTGQGYVMDELRVGSDVFCRSDSGSQRTSSEPIILQLW